jgi:uncharacterized membrane protein YraQ (UPF0718 family)/copper chaperone CopZ
MTTLNTFVQAAWATALELAPWLLVGAAAAGLVHWLVPAGAVRRHLGGRGGVAKAVALGVPMPLCSCGVIPAGLGLKRDGASDGAAVGFLISTPQTGVDSILVTASFLGWPFALFKVVAAALMGLVGGWLTDRGRDAPLPALPGTPTSPRTLRDGIEHGVELLRSIWRELLVGVAVSAAITVLVPPGALARLAAGAGPVAPIALALVISVPLYVCATASVPIAASLVAAGLPTGAALVFLMAGPATNLATIGAVRRAFGGRVLGVYLGTIIGGSAALGLLFDAWIGGSGAAWLPSVTSAHAHAGHDHAAAPSVLALLSAAALLGLLGWFALDELRMLLRRSAPRHAHVGHDHGHAHGGDGDGGHGHELRGSDAPHPGGGASQPAPGDPPAPTAASPAAAPAVNVHELAVEGMSCNGCVRKLDGRLRALAGVEDVLVELEPGRAVVRGAVDERALREVVAAAGYRVVDA